MKQSNFCNNFIFPDETFRYKTDSFSVIVKVNNRGGKNQIYQAQTQFESHNVKCNMTLIS